MYMKCDSKLGHYTERAWQHLTFFSPAMLPNIYYKKRKFIMVYDTYHTSLLRFCCVS